MKFKSPKRSVWLLFTIGGFTLIVAQHFIHPNSTRSATSEVKDPAVAVYRVSRRPFEKRVVATGSIAAKDELPVSARASGLQVVEVLVEEGDLVKREQILARLDDAVLRSELSEEEALLESSKAGYDKSIQPNTTEEIAIQASALSAARTAVERNQTALEKARLEWTNTSKIAQRYTFLLKEGGATEEEVDQKKTDAATSHAALKSAQQSLEESKQTVRQAIAKLQQLQRGGRSEDVRIAKAAVKQYEAKIQQLKAKLEQTLVRAPDSGLIIERTAHIGDASATGETMFKLARRQQLEMIAMIGQEDLDSIRVGQAVDLTDGKRTYKGTVSLKSPTVDVQSRLGRVHVAVLANQGLLQGMFATATINCGQNIALVIPQSALQHDENTGYVFVCANGTCHKTPVQTGEQTEDSVVITGGLKEGDLVVTDGATLVNDKSKVQVLELHEAETR